MVRASTGTARPADPRVGGFDLCYSKSAFVPVRPRDVADLQIPRERIRCVIALEARRVDLAAASSIRLQMPRVVPRRRTKVPLYELRLDLVRIEVVDAEGDVVDARHPTGALPNDGAAGVAHVDRNLVAGESA